MATPDGPKSSKPSKNNSSLGKFDRIQWRAEVALISYGVRLGIRANEPTILEDLSNYLPPGWEPSPSPMAHRWYSFVVAETPQGAGGFSTFQLYRDRHRLARTSDREEVLEALNSDLSLQVGLLVQHRLFVHAGVVGWQGGAIVIPGRSFSGKTTLVEALVKAGATYYSDEYAVLDSEGLVHSYPRQLGIRTGASRYANKKQYSAEELGGKVGTQPLSVRLVVHTQYQSGAQWHPNPISPGQAALALLDNTIVARIRPQFALPILSRAVAGAVALEGKRGEAQAVAVEILKRFKFSPNGRNNQNPSPAYR